MFYMESQNKENSNLYDLLHQLYQLEDSIRILSQQQLNENDSRLKEYQIIRKKILSKLLSDY